jgi:tetratricopeptide (TPR) repeat protein
VVAIVGQNAHTKIMLRVCLIVTLLTSSTLTLADQTDRRLDGLFVQLRTTEDPELGAVLTGKIWDIWRHTDNEAAAKLMEQGTHAMALEHYDDALVVLDEVVKAAPEYAEGWNTRATVLYLMGDYSASAVDVRRTLALEPRHFGAWSGLGLIYMHVGDERAALEAFAKALEWNPHLRGSRYNLEMIKKHLQEQMI